MFGNIKTTLAFAGATILGASLFAATFGTPATQDEGYSKEQSRSTSRGTERDAGTPRQTRSNAQPDYSSDFEESYDGEDDTFDDSEEFDPVGFDEEEEEFDLNAPLEPTDDGGGIEYSDPKPDYEEYRTNRIKLAREREAREAKEADSLYSDSDDLGYYEDDEALYDDYSDY